MANEEVVGVGHKCALRRACFDRRTANGMMTDDDRH